MTITANLRPAQDVLDFTNYPATMGNISGSDAAAPASRVQTRPASGPWTLWKTGGGSWRTGDPFDVNGEEKTVAFITTFGAATDSPGQGRNADREGSVAARLTFTDRTSPLVRFTLPIAEPAQ